MSTIRRVRVRRTCVSALLGVCVAAGAAHAGEIYKSTDAQGRPVYSDRPLSGAAERMIIESKPRDEAQAQARLSRELADLARREAERRRETAAAQAEKQAREQAEKARQDRCVAARNRYITFTEGHRLYRRDASGERVYYTGEEIDAERSAAKQQMDEACQGAPPTR